MAGSRKSDRRFKDRSELLDFLLEVSSAASSTLDLDALLKSLGEFIRRAVPCDVAAILLYSERVRGLRVRYSIGLHQDRVEDLVIPLDEGITGVAASARMPVNVGDVRADPRYIPVLDAMRSELAIPMMLRNRLVGVIDMQSVKLNAFSNEDSALLQLVASRVASSLMNARLFRRVERQNRTLRTLSHVSQEFSSILDLDQLLATVATTVRRLINFDAFSIMLYDKPSNLLRNRFTQRYDQRITADSVPFGKGITGAACESRRPVVVEDVRSDPRYIEITPGIRSEVAIPLLAPDRIVGVMDLESERVGYFTQDHVHTLQPLAPLIAGAIVNASLYEEISSHKERMETDLAAAQRLQQVLLPREDPGIKGLDIGVGFRPAHEITGDVFDFFEYADDYAIICCGDVSGKSAAAALYGAMVTGLLRTLAPRRRTPAALMQTLNDALVERQVAGKYLTLLVLLWQPRTGVFTMSNAAAVPPMVCRRGQIILPQMEGFPLGMFPNRSYEESTFQTEPGDVILLYSDGIQDQQNEQGHDYGATRLPHFFSRICNMPPRELVEVILQDFDSFRGSKSIHDDQTLVALRVTGP